eukprot:m.128916 g.128916  ORF g.128916 m.128916 type:complete len:79 (-) comp13649_c0_seq2:104-340(-)
MLDTLVGVLRPDGGRSGGPPAVRLGGRGVCGGGGFGFPVVSAERLKGAALMARLDRDKSDPFVAWVPRPDSSLRSSSI